MKIYTRGGDKGSTHVYVNKPIRVDKNDAIIEVYGTLDELNANLGLLCAKLKNHKEAEMIKEALQDIQRNIFEAGYALSANSKLSDKDIEWLEKDIDHITSMLPRQTQFILPGGCEEASLAHVCRTVCRRAERQLVALSKQEEIDDLTLAYLNRLSDWLFVFSRWLNYQADIDDILVR